ncbi:MAG: tRNA epoxyqueuosine(34) reductase QueG [Pseudomonadota bacterium]
MPTSTSKTRARAVKETARVVGFDEVGVCAADAIPQAPDRLKEFLAAGRHGDMAWMADRAAARSAPNALWPEARSVILVGLNYGPAKDPMTLLKHKEKGVISVYAQNADYHDVVKKKLKRLARAIVAKQGGEVKVFVDTAPVMEKPLAGAAGLGWQGKHTNLVSRAFGSWLFLGVIYTTLDLETDEPGTDHCGQCRSCLDICPTDAFPTPYKLDARRCISYLTIEHKGHIPEDFRDAIGNRIYGCDDCLAVCPWNKFAATAREAKFHARPELAAPDLADLAQLDDAGFRTLFSGSPIKRIGRDRFLRNVLIAIGNSEDENLAPYAERLLDDPSAIVRAMAVRAIGRLCDQKAFESLKRNRHTNETDEDTRREWSRKYCA